MPFDYSGLSDSAVNLITDKGRDVDFISDTQGTYDPVTDTITGDSTATVTVKMVILNFNKKDVDGTLIRGTDRLGLLSAGSVTTAPKNGDRVVDGEDVLTIKGVEEISPGGTVLLYKLQLRGFSNYVREVAEDLTGALLSQDNSFLLLENGDKILFEGN
jgi:hypothetical protein